MNKHRSKAKHDSKNGNKELRISVQPQKFEIRANPDGSRSIVGYAAVFNSLSQDLGGFKEKIQPGAFSKSLKDNPDVIALYGHDNLNILGRVSSGTLTISEDRKGLLFNCKLPNTSVANDLIALMERGDLSAMSFGFLAVQDDWQNVDGLLIRTLIEVILMEISVVGSPAYTDTSVSLRSIPKALRGFLDGGKSPAKPDDADDDTDCDDDEKDEDGNCPEDRCDCECEACQADECANCSDPECEDTSCMADDCPGQSTRSLRQRLYQLQRRAVVDLLENAQDAAYKVDRAFVVERLNQLNPPSK